MRFTKAEVLETFKREDTSYRLAIICTHWLRNTANFKPSAADEARGLKMKAGGQWISYADLADELEQQIPRDAIVSDFILTQLHALIRAPFEVLSNYCGDYDKENPDSHLLRDLKATDWYAFTRIIRNAVSHNFRFEFRDSEKRRMPITWRHISITAELDGKAMRYDTFWHRPGYELFLEMRAFANAMPEPASGRTPGCRSDQDC
jgi:hypothetical protein